MISLQDALLKNFSQRKGVQIVPGHDGRSAVKISNTNRTVGESCVYLETGIPAFANFTLKAWIKAPKGGYGGWCDTQEMTPKDTFLSFNEYTPEQRNRVAVLCANIPLFEDALPGFMITLAQPRNYASVYFMAEGQLEPFIIWKLRSLQDGRWHHLVITVDRKRTLCVYVDGKVIEEVDISAWEGASIHTGPLIVGADSQGCHGLFDATISDFCLLSGIQSDQEINKDYYRGALGVLGQEIFHRRLNLYYLYDVREVQALLYKVQNAYLRLHSENPIELYQKLKQEYEVFLLNTEKQADFQFMLISDAHCDGEDGSRTQVLRNALRWANELKMQAVLDCGDYSNFGKDFELESYWNSMTQEWNKKPLFVSLGNHETLELKSEDLVTYHCGKLSKQGMVPEDYKKFYYKGEIGGFPVIVLAQYSDTYTITGYNKLWVQAGEIKQEQVDFLQTCLDDYCVQDKPVFLLIHNALKPLMDQQTDGRSPEHSTILKGDALYDVLKGRKNVVICTGHVHNGFGGGAGCYLLPDGYHAIDVVGFRCSTFGYGLGVEDEPGPHHCGYFVYLFDRALLLRAADFATREWLTAYDQVIQLYDVKTDGKGEN